LKLRTFVFATLTAFVSANHTTAQTIVDRNAADTNAAASSVQAVLSSPIPVLRPASLVTARANAAPHLQPTDVLLTTRNAHACNRRLSRAIPRRSGRAQDGNAFLAALDHAGGNTRDHTIAREILTGNVPSFMRTLVPVIISVPLQNGDLADVTACVTPDYLALGSDTDFVRVPLGLGAAQHVADRFDMILPTTTMVDAIYSQADVRLAPQPMTPGAQMTTTPYFVRHNATIEQQRQSAGGQLGLLIAGHKKDLVTNRLARAPGRVAIYGWHRPGGNPIQPLSTVHDSEYADYSHGIRLVSKTAFVNGRAIDLGNLLQNRQIAWLPNGNGVGLSSDQLALLSQN